MCNKKTFRNVLFFRLSSRPIGKKTGFVFKELSLTDCLCIGSVHAYCQQIDSGSSDFRLFAIAECQEVFLNNAKEERFDAINMFIYEYIYRN